MDIELTDEQSVALASLRGGCSCHISPPCSNCVEPIKEEEALALGIIKEPVVTDKVLVDVANWILDTHRNELFALKREELETKWYFKFDPKRGAAANLYNFHDMLGLYERQCEEWETHHNGHCCVVGRVRDQYLMPKIQQFLKDLKTLC